MTIHLALTVTAVILSTVLVALTGYQYVLSKRVQKTLDRHADVMMRIVEARRWLAEFPEVRDALDWVIRDERIMKSANDWNISSLRSTMRSRSVTVVVKSSNGGAYRYTGERLTVAS